MELPENFYKGAITRVNEMWAEHDHDMEWIMQALQDGLREADCWLPGKVRETIRTKIYLAYREELRANH